MASSSEQRNKATGGCACGAVRFAFYEPVTVKLACHCRACQYTSGGGPAYVVVVPKQQFRVIRGHPAEFTTLSDAGHLVTRSFCTVCGTHLYAMSESNPGHCSVKVGALDAPAAFRPKLHLWTSEAQPWHRKHPFTLRFRRNPPVRKRSLQKSASEPEAPEESPR